MQELIAITGATGYIGGRMAPVLVEAGYCVRCLARSPRKLEGRAWAGKADLVEVDLENEAATREALQGCSAAYYLVHSMIVAGEDYADKDREMAQQFGRAAAAAGVKRIVYLGGLGESGEGLSEHLRSRREVEEALGEAGVPVTVLRAAMIIGSGSASFEILRYLVERLPVMVTPKWVSTPSQPIAVRNVIRYLTGVLEKKETAGETYDIGGPDVMTYREIMREMAAALGLRKRYVIPVPVLTPRLSSYWIHLVTPLSHRIAKPLAEGLRNPVLCRESRIREIVPQKLLTIREAMEAALRKVAERGVETTWSMAGPIPGDPDWAGGTVYRDARTTSIAAPPQAVFNAVCRLGGGHGWYAVNWLWRIRGALDVLFGGPGLRRGRRDPEQVAYGEALDFWRVTGIERDERLELRAEMKLPGEAMLEFRMESDPEGRTRLTQEARFKPRGLAGLLYWWMVTPFHALVFQGMLRGIRREAERRSDR
jgi:uncharacterized protein YbjT (DUF2867 family)